jgi:DNA polymerase III delta prime subunit
LRPVQSVTSSGHLPVHPQHYGERELKMNEESIETIQSMFQSDIRSMINFIQLNQNMNFMEWEKKIVHRGLLENIHTVITTDASNTKKYICDISEQYNIDKKSILLKYFHFVLREKAYTNNVFGIMEEILHNTDVKAEVMLNYFCDTVPHVTRARSIQ